jgi:hypothetical protein
MLAVTGQTQLLSLRIVSSTVSLSIQIPAASTVLDLKNGIRVQTGIPVEQQHLLFDNQLMDSKGLLTAAGVVNGSAIQLLVASDTFSGKRIFYFSLFMFHLSYSLYKLPLHCRPSYQKVQLFDGLV